MVPIEIIVVGGLLIVAWILTGKSAGASRPATQKTAQPQGSVGEELSGTEGTDGTGSVSMGGTMGATMGGSGEDYGDDEWIALQKCLDPLTGDTYWCKPGDKTKVILPD